jgi:predicted nucleotidyltransferase
MDTTVQDELDKLKKIIVNTVPVEQIFLFGSYAYGTPHKDSDLDLYVDIIAKNQPTPPQSGRGMVVLTRYLYSGLIPL